MLCCCHMIASCLQAHRVWISMAQCLLLVVLSIQTTIPPLDLYKMSFALDVRAHANCGNDGNVFMAARHASSNFACMRGLWWVFTCCGRVIDSYRTLLRTFCMWACFRKNCLVYTMHTYIYGITRRHTHTHHVRHICAQCNEQR